MAKCEKLLPFILKWEGGFSNDPADPGGATNKGVTIETWRSVGYDKDGDGDIDVQDLKKLTDNDVLNRVLKPAYWDRWQADTIKSQKVANILVDWVWCSGKHGIVIPQRLLGLTADGIVGNKSIAAVNSMDADKLFSMIYESRVNFLNGIVDASINQYLSKVSRKVTEKELLTHTSKRFIKGWLNRLEALKKI